MRGKEEEFIVCHPNVLAYFQNTGKTTTPYQTDKQKEKTVLLSGLSTFKGQLIYTFYLASNLNTVVV